MIKAQHMHTHLFPKHAVVVDLKVPRGVVDLTHFEKLHPLERAQADHAVASRKAEFGDARWCAHRALHLLGASEETANSPILRGHRGAPLWPMGYCGSLTHTTGYRAALVASTEHIRSIGIDAEPAEALPDGILGSIARPAERRQIDQLRSAGIPFADRLLFCAKEATYKAWFPLTQRWLGFDQAEIDIRLDGTLISYLLTRPTPVPFISGRWALVEGYVLVTTAVF